MNNRMRGVGCTGDNSCSLGFPLYSNDNNTNDKQIMIIRIIRILVVQPTPKLKTL